MTTLPTISQHEIQARVGGQSFQRGQQYFRDGAIFGTRRQGLTLKARCEGSQGAAYRLWVTFEEGDGIAAADCSCPVGDGGYCKHIAALLLTWQARPDEFITVEDVDTALERRTKAELIALVKQMLRQQPDLEHLLETPLPSAGKRKAPVNPETYRRQARAILRGGADYDDWDRGPGPVDELLAMTEIGDGFLAQQDYAGAAAVYAAVAGAVLENYEMYDDEEGEHGSVVGACVEGLGACLAGETEDAAMREQILRALFDIYHFDVDLGGVGLGDGVPDLLVNHATAEEKRTVAGWVRESLPAGTGWSDDFRRNVYGGLLLDLELETLDDETYLRICRETGRTGDLVDRLLTLGRLDDATTVAEGVDDYVLLGLADIFVQHDHGDVAERLVAARSQATQDTRVLEWLKNRYQARGDLAAALELALRLFRARSSLAGYQEIRALAQPLGRWEALRPGLRAFLKESRLTHVLVEIYLDEGEIDNALEAVTSTGASTPYNYYGPSMALNVARAAEETRPRAALEIYQQEAERLIEQRGRDNYQTACAYLARVRDLYDALGERDTWAGYIAGLRERNRALRAFKEELATAGL